MPIDKTINRICARAQRSPTDDDIDIFVAAAVKTARYNCKRAADNFRPYRAQIGGYKQKRALTSFVC